MYKFGGSIFEAVKKRFTAKEMVKILKGKDFGMTEAGGNGDVAIKGNIITVKKSFYYDGDREMKFLKKAWMPGGYNYEYFKDVYGVEPKIVGANTYIRDGRIYGKKAKDGVVEVSFTI